MTLSVAVIFIQSLDKGLRRLMAYDSGGGILCLNVVVLSILGFAVQVLQNESNWRWVSRLSTDERLWPFVYQLPRLNGLVALSTAMTLLLVKRFPSQRRRGTTGSV